MDLFAESSARITVLAIAVALVLRVLRIRSPRVLQRVWAAVTVVMLLQPVLVAWGLELFVAVLPSPAVAGIREPAASAVAETTSNRIRLATVTPEASSTGLAWSRARNALWAVYIAGLAVLVVRLAVGRGSSAARA